MPLLREHANAAAEFFRSAIWLDVCRVANESKPGAAQIGDTQEIAAAKSHQRAGWEACLESLTFAHVVTESAPLEDPVKRLASLGVPQEALENMRPVHED